ncbi:MAG: hypothetical protein MUC89_13675 [Acetobacteraceae bacterium]|jgi:hypothetical protein|nr:hypothetical protein [Acetobacteraceae bacterium]
MDRFDQRRSLSLVLGIAALGFAMLVAHVNEVRDARHSVPTEASAASPGRG